MSGPAIFSLHTSTIPHKQQTESVHISSSRLSSTSFVMLCVMLCIAQSHFPT